MALPGPGLCQVDWVRGVDALYEGGFDFVLSVEHEDPLSDGNEDRIETGLRPPTKPSARSSSPERTLMTQTRGFFDTHQRETVAAAMARMIPTDNAPGAREAGTIDFLDRYLSGIEHVYAKADGSGFETLEGKRAEAWQQRLDILRDKYVKGIAELDRSSQDEFGADFIQLTEEQQDQVLTQLEYPSRVDQAAVEEAKTVAAWSPVEPALQQSMVEIALDFVPLLALHTRQGFYADPIYGGNKDRLGWQVIGFPGPASLADVHSGRYSVLDYFIDRRGYPGTEDEHGV